MSAWSVSKNNWAAKEPRITMIELRKRIRKILRREKVSGTAGKALGVASPVVAVAHSGQRSFAAQLFFDTDQADIGILRSLWLGMTAMWLVVLLAVRKRRNVAKNIVYLNLAVGLICVYWDFLSGWHRWSLNYAVPIVLAASIIALLITVRVIRMEVGEYIVYSGLTVLLGLTPIVFLVFGWVTQPLPSAICAAISLLALVVLQVYRGAEVRHELAKRLHL